VGDQEKHLLDKRVMETGRYSGSKFSISPPSLGGGKHVIPGRSCNAESVKNSGMIRGIQLTSQVLVREERIKIAVNPRQGAAEWRTAYNWQRTGPDNRTVLRRNGFATSLFSFASSSETPGHA
jgi:hypothetical protein